MSDRQLPDYNSLMIGICEAIRGTRIERHITVRQLAFLVDIPEKEIYDIEMLKSSALTFWNYYALARWQGDWACRWIWRRQAILERRWAGSTT